MNISELIAYQFEDQAAAVTTVYSAPSTQLSDALPAVQLETFTEVYVCYGINFSKHLSSQNNHLVGEILINATLLHWRWQPSVGELQARSKANEDLIKVAYNSQAKKNGMFVKLPDIIHGTFQMTRFKQDCSSNKQSEPFYTQLISSEVETLIKQLLVPEHNFQLHLYLFGSVGIGKSYVLYQVACRLLTMREKCRVVYINNAASGTFYRDYIMALASVLYDKEDGPALAKLAPLIDSQRLYQGEASIEEQIRAIWTCVLTLTQTRPHLYVIAIIDQTNNIKQSDSPTSTYQIMSQDLQNITRCLYSGSANNEQPRAPAGYQVEDMPVRISQDKMWLLIRQLFPDVADQIKSLSSLELCYEITGGIMNEIANFCRVGRGKIGQPPLVPKDLQQRIEFYRKDYLDRFPDGCHDNYLSKNEGKEYDRRKSNMISALDSAFLGIPLLDSVRLLDRRFLYTEEDDEGNAIVRFMTPLSVECVLPSYTLDILKPASTVLPLIEDTEFNNAQKCWLIEYFIISQLKLNAKISKPFTFTVHSYKRKRTTLTFKDYDTVRFRKQPSSEHVPANNTNRLLLPVEYNHPTFDFYYYSHEKKALFCLQVTIRQDMGEKLREFEKTCDETMKQLQQTFGTGVNYYIIIMGLEENCQRIIFDRRFNTAKDYHNVAYLDSLVFTDSKFIIAIQNLVAQNKASIEAKKKAKQAGDH